MTGMTSIVTHGNGGFHRLNVGSDDADSGHYRANGQHGE